jgi:hypothetical protein
MKMKLVKKEISQILKEKRNWINTGEEKPETMKPVVMRLCHNTLRLAETATEIHPLEDVKVGIYDLDCGAWKILPPQPKYDFSPLSVGGAVKENVSVTHWAELEEGELEGWKTRFDLIRSYKKLELNIDPEYEKDLYRALLLGAFFINQYSQKAEDKKLTELLYDLQHCIDFGNITEETKE